MRRGWIRSRSRRTIRASIDTDVRRRASEIDFSFIEKGTAQNLVLRDTCGAGPGSGAGYGVNVYQSERITVDNVNAKGFADAGVYIGAIASTGDGELVVRGNETFGSSRGIIIEEVAPEADVSVRNNEMRNNGTGIFVHVSDARTGPCSPLPHKADRKPGILPRAHKSTKTVDIKEKGIGGP